MPVESLPPPPIAFGLPEKFQAWSPDQWAAVMAAMDSPRRVVALNLPTGAGKTLINLAIASLTGGRAVCLTGTKGLQAQIAADGASMGLVTVQGQNNYPCVALQPGGAWASLADDVSGGDGDDGQQTRCDRGPCHSSLPCVLREGGCTYYDQVRLATGADLVCTNYSYWFAQKRFGKGLGHADLILADEAHAIAGELSSAMQIKVEKWLVQVLGLTPPGPGVPVDQWKSWGAYQAAALTKAFDAPVQGLSRKALQYRRRQKMFASVGQALASMTPGDWIEDHTPEAWVFDCLRPKAYVESLLVQGAEKIILTSATVTEATLDELGFDLDDRVLVSFPSRFPVERRPVWYVPTIRMKYGEVGPAEVRLLVSRVDQILDRWPDEKGILHSVSYPRAKEIQKYSRHRDRMIVPTDGRETKRAVERYLTTPGPWVLVSPALTTGWDFPGASCRFQIVVKLPFPGSQSKTLQARAALDKRLIANMMAQALVQSLGRGMRSASDWCVSYLLDTQWDWVRGKYKAFFPAWFLAAVKESATIPVRPPWAKE
jgi:Rad3-related DNA helicase